MYHYCIITILYYLFHKIVNCLQLYFNKENKWASQGVHCLKTAKIFVSKLTPTYHFCDKKVQALLLILLCMPSSNLTSRVVEDY